MCAEEMCLATAIDRLHDRIARVLENFGALYPRPPEDVAGRSASLISLLVRTFVAEESHLHPVLARFAEGEDLVEANLCGHDEAETLMERLGTLDCADPDFWPIWLDLIDVLRDHLGEAGPHSLRYLHGHDVDAGVLGLLAETDARLGAH